MLSLTWTASFIQLYSQLKPCPSNYSLYVEKSGFNHLRKEFLVFLCLFFPRQSPLLQGQFLSFVDHSDTTMINMITKTTRKLIHPVNPDIRTGFTGNKAVGHILSCDRSFTASFKVSRREILCNEREGLLSEGKRDLII